jgi:hypothetical protein
MELLCDDIALTALWFSYLIPSIILPEVAGYGFKYRLSLYKFQFSILMSDVIAAEYNGSIKYRHIHRPDNFTVALGLNAS